MILVDTRTAFEADGFVVQERPLVDGALLARADAAFDRVLAQDPGTDPVGVSRHPVAGPTGLVKIDQGHLLDPDLYALVTDPAIGRFAAELTGAEMIQLWAVQLLHKPSGSVGGTGNVGWHQDQQYWKPWWEGEVFTVWLAVSDVELERGPLLFVRGSHRWGLDGAGDFFDGDLDQLRSRLAQEDRTWDEVPGVLPAGGASAHHKLTLHGSGPNTGPTPRRSFALHLRTERSQPLPTSESPYTGDWLRDPHMSPVLFQR